LAFFCSFFFFFFFFFFLFFSLPREVKSNKKRTTRKAKEAKPEENRRESKKNKVEQEEERAPVATPKKVGARKKRPAVKAVVPQEPEVEEKLFEYKVKGKKIKAPASPRAKASVGKRRSPRTAGKKEEKEAEEVVEEEEEEEEEVPVAGLEYLFSLVPLSSSRATPGKGGAHLDEAIEIFKQKVRQEFGYPSIDEKVIEKEQEEISRQEKALRDLKTHLLLLEAAQKDAKKSEQKKKKKKKGAQKPTETRSDTVFPEHQAILDSGVDAKAAGDYVKLLIEAGVVTAQFKSQVDHLADLQSFVQSSLEMMGARARGGDDLNTPRKLLKQ
jgi:hypothetical protein